MPSTPPADSRPVHHHWLLKVPVVVFVCALAALVVFIATDKQPSTAAHPAAAPTSARPNVGPSLWAKKLSDDNLQDFVNNPTGSQVSYTRLSDGFHTGTSTERFARPALSLIKLYIADYVLEHGTSAQRSEAIRMIETSDDKAAEELTQAYPEAIDATAQRYGLLSTRSSESWGYSVTSTFDVVSYISQKITEDPTSPVLVAMRRAQPVAADGYAQDFGTAVLPGVEGSKWGWSNDLSLHSSVSFGKDFVVAAAVVGTADDLTNLVRTQLGPYFDLPAYTPTEKPSARPLPTGAPASSSTAPSAEPTSATSSAEPSAQKTTPAATASSSLAPARPTQAPAPKVGPTPVVSTRNSTTPARR